MAAKKKPLWVTDEEYMEWARGEAAKVKPVNFRIKSMVEAGSGTIHDSYHGQQNEDD